MADTFPDPPGGAHLRTVAMPRDANSSGDIFGGWTLSQMDLAGGTFAVGFAHKRVVTAHIAEVTFLQAVSVGDDVSVFCSLVEEGHTSIKVRIDTWARPRGGDARHKVTEGIFTYVAVDEHGKPRPLDDQPGD